MSRITGSIRQGAAGKGGFGGGDDIKRGESPFQHGVKFTISDWDVVKLEIDGKVASDARELPVFITSVGDLFLNMVTRAKVDKEGKILTPNGTFNQFVKECITKHTTNAEILNAIVQGCKDKEIIVRRTPFVAESRLGTSYASALVELDFFEQK